MLASYISPKGIQLGIHCRDWREAVEAGARPLLQQGIIKMSYIKAIEENHLKFGPYMVIAPGIMLAHARPEQGAVGMGLTIMTLANPVVTGSSTNDPVRIIFTLATPDETSHLNLLEELTGFLMERGAVDKLLAAKTIEEATVILQGKKERGKAV